MSAGAIDAGRANITLALDAKGLQAGLNAAAQSVEQTAGAMSANGAQIAGAFGAAGKAAELFDARTGKALGQLAQKLGPAVAMVDKLWSAISAGAATSAAQIGGVTTALNAQAGALGRVAAGAKAAAASLAAMAKANPVMAGAAVGVGSFALGRWLQGTIGDAIYGKVQAPDLQDTATKYAARENEYADALSVTIARLDLLAKKTRLTAEERQRAAQLIGQLEQAGVGGYALTEGGVTATGGAADAVTARRIAAQQAIIDEQSRNRAALQATMNDITSDKARWGSLSQEELDSLQKKIADDMTAAMEKQLAAAKEIARLKGEGAEAAKAALEAEKKAAAAEAKAAEEAAKNAAALEQMRGSIDKAEADVAAAAAQREEARALAAGEIGAGELAQRYGERAAGAQYRASEIVTAMQGMAAGSTEYKQAAADFAAALKEYQSAAARAQELTAAAQEQQRKAAAFAAGGVGAIDAARGLSGAQSALARAISGAQAAGDVAGLQAAQDAAQAFALEARAAAEAARGLAAADGIVTAEEEKRVAALDSVYAGAAQQVDALADALAATSARAEKMGITGGGGTDAQAVFSRAMADAMKNSKSEEYQKKTADATGKMADYLSKLKGKALTFE